MAERNARSPDLRKKVERQSMFMKIALAADILVTVVIGGGAILWAVRSPQADIIVLAAITWIFLAAAWFMALRLNRGNWSPAALDTAAFVDLSIRRCQARLKAVWFGAGLFVVELAFCLPWVYNYSAKHSRSFLSWLWFSSPYIDGVWVATMIFFVFLIWYRQRKQAELTWLQNVSR